MPKIYHNIDFNYLKTVYKMLCYSCKKLPKTDDNDRKHKNDANMLS